MPPTRTLLSLAFWEDYAPAELSVSIVSLVELCNLAMPDPVQLRARIKEAGFEQGPDERAQEAARLIALDNQMVSWELRNFRHEFYGKVRDDAPVFLLLSEADGREGPMVFVSTLFLGATQADAIKAAEHVTKKQPLTGANTTNGNNHPIRRVFWELDGTAGIRWLVVSGPEHIELSDWPRAFIAFNKAGKRK